MRVKKKFWKTGKEKRKTDSELARKRAGVVSDGGGGQQGQLTAS